MDIKACTVHSPSNTQHYTVSVLLISSPQSTLSNLRSGREVRDFWVPNSKEVYVFNNMEVVIKLNSYNNSIIVSLPDFTDEKLKLKDIK